MALDRRFVYFGVFLDAERNKSPTIRDLGTAARFMTFGPHPCAAYTWRMYNELRAELGLKVYDNPEDMFYAATRQLLSGGRSSKAYFEWIHSHKMNPAMEELLAGIDPAFLDGDTSKCSIYSFDDRVAAARYLNVYISRVVGVETTVFTDRLAREVV